MITAEDARRSSGPVPATATSALTVAYLVSLFPCWSETFILREILALREKRVNVRILSLRQASETLVHDAARPLVGQVLYPPAAWRLALGLVLGLARDRRMRAATRHALREAGPRGGREIAKALYTLAAAAYFAGVVRQLGIQHIHAHWATYPALAARVMNEIAGIRFTFTAHAHDIFLPNPYLVSNIAAADRVVTISEYNRRYLAPLGTAADKLTVVPCGIDFREFDAIDSRRPKPGLIMAVGRLEPIKGFTYLVDACARLRDRGVAVECDIVGDGSLRAELQRQIADRDLGAVVHLRGAQDARTVRELLSRATVFALPCVRTPAGDQDGVPVALMEAMAIGLPVVTTPISGIPDLVADRTSGLLVPSADADALADALERVLADHALRETLGAGARRDVRTRHNLERSVERLRSMFLDIVYAQ